MNLAENDDHALELDEEEVDEDHCTICLQAIVDRALIPECSHEFCFECLMIWSEQSRRCPLCAQVIGDYLIHHIRSTYDYQKHFLAPLRTSPRPLSRIDGARIAPVTYRRRERVWGRRDRSAQDEADALQRAVSRRRWIYRHNLYAKHVASNTYTRYRPYPTPSQFASSQDLISRMTIFLRRELLVWPNADVEFLVTFVISLMKSIDIRSESAVKLLAEFLDLDTQYVVGERHVNAEHFAHEIYCYLRSPYRDLGIYDSVVQYDTPPGIPPPPSHERTRRWESGHQSQSSRSESPNLRSSHSHSHPTSIREWNTMQPERSLSLSGENISRPNSSHTHAKGKGKRRASARSLSPSEFDINCHSPVARHGRTGSPGVLITPNLFLFEKTPERNAAVSCTPTGDARGEASPLLPRAPENNSGGVPVVLPRLPDGNPSIACATDTTNDRLSALNGPRSLDDDDIIASSSSMSETPKLTINTNRARANPTREPRFRSQRDTIIAHLRGSVTTTSRQSTQSLLARMTDQTAAELDVSGDDDPDVARRTVGSPSGEGHVQFASSIRTAERSSGLSDSDDPPGGPKREDPDSEERAVTKAGAYLIQSVQEGPMQQPGPPTTTPPCSGGITSSHAHLLDRLYDDDDEKTTTATEARLRTQVRLRARLAAERRLAHDNV